MDRIPKGTTNLPLPQDPGFMIEDWKPRDGRRGLIHGMPFASGGQLGIARVSGLRCRGEVDWQAAADSATSLKGMSPEVADQ